MEQQANRVSAAAPPFWHDIRRARAIVMECVARGYNSCYWRDMVASPECTARGCLLDCLQPALARERWPEAAFYAALSLRQKFPGDSRTWKSFAWAEHVDDVLSTVHAAVAVRASLPAPPFEETEAAYEPADIIQTNGFVPWRLFRRRGRVPRRPGIYILAQFDGLPDVEASPLSESVIYIGQSDVSVGQRLTDFETTALGGFGHSAGWTYLTELATDWESLRLFRNTYVAWKVYARGCAGKAREEEAALIQGFVRRFQRRPWLNRQN